MVVMRPAPRPALIRAMISGVMSCNSFIQELVATRTNSTPSGVMLSGVVTAAICGPTNPGHSGMTCACPIRRAKPARFRYPASASATATGRLFGGRLGRSVTAWIIAGSYCPVNS